MSLRTRLRRPLATAMWCALLGVGGCGQKGALYLPDRTPEAVPATPAATTVPATRTPADEEATRRKIPQTPDPATAQ